jgi:Protein of unknown function (DUF2950)
MNIARSHAARIAAAALICASLALSACTKAPAHRTFATPEDAVRALIDASKDRNLDDVAAIFGPEGRKLVDSSDVATARLNREIFLAAIAERWRLDEQGANGRVLVIGNEDWPFPVPLVKDADGWRFDTEAGTEEILDRRIGRNELAAIKACLTYVAAQRLYAARGHDGAPAGVFATSFRSASGRENGLYWPAKHGQHRSPLGDLVAQASIDAAGQGQGEPSPFHGYFFRILTRQGAAAGGGAKDYVVNGKMTGGFALVAWPAEYETTGIMTFVAGPDGVVREKDLGAETSAARQMAAYDPDATWVAAGAAPRQ